MTSIIISENVSVDCQLVFSFSITGKFEEIGLELSTVLENGKKHVRFPGQIDPSSFTHSDTDRDPFFIGPLLKGSVRTWNVARVKTRNVPLQVRLLYSVDPNMLGQGAILPAAINSPLSNSVDLSFFSLSLSLFHSWFYFAWPVQFAFVRLRAAMLEKR